MAVRGSDTCLSKISEPGLQYFDTENGNIENINIE